MNSDVDIKSLAKETIEKIKNEARRDYKFKFDNLQIRLTRVIEEKLQTENGVHTFLTECN